MTSAHYDMTAYTDCTFVQNFSTTEDYAGRTFYGSVRKKIGGEFLAEIIVDVDFVAKTFVYRIPAAVMATLPLGKFTYAVDYVTEGSEEPLPFMDGEINVMFRGAKPE